MRQRLRQWFYEDVRKVQSGRHAPQMPRFVPSLILLLVLTVIGLWLIFASFARLTVGSSVSYWWPNPGSVPKGQLFNIVRSTVTAAGVFAGLFAVVYAYRKQRVDEAAGKRADEEALSQRYQDAATQLGSERPAIRLAGVYALARLADDWPEQRQVCIDVLCAYIRMPWDPSNTASREEAQVHKAIFAVMRQHLVPGAHASWSTFQFDFTLARIDSVDLRDAIFANGVSFQAVTFTGICNLMEVAFQSPANFTGSSVRQGVLNLRHITLTGGFLSAQHMTVRDGSEFHLSVADGGMDDATHRCVELTALRLQNSRLTIDMVQGAGNALIELVGVEVSRGSEVVVEPERGDWSHARFLTLIAKDWNVEIGGIVNVQPHLVQSGVFVWNSRGVAQSLPRFAPAPIPPPAAYRPLSAVLRKSRQTWRHLKGHAR